MNVDEFVAALSKELSSYSEEITEGIKKSVDIVGKETNAEIKKHITFNQITGDYVKSFRVKKVHESKNKKIKTWYVANGNHRLTHLLENGHALWQGGRTEAYPHIKYGEELARKRMEELSMEVINNANKR
ncbi:MAG: Phage protein, HK97 gp10 family [uncultured Clostridium sp.]